jgi:hypothetical protein
VACDKQKMALVYLFEWKYFHSKNTLMQVSYFRKFGFGVYSVLEPNSSYFMDALQLPASR